MIYLRYNDRISLQVCEDSQTKTFLQDNIDLVLWVDEIAMQAFWLSQNLQYIRGAESFHELYPRWERFSARKFDVNIYLKLLHFEIPQVD